MKKNIMLALVLGLIPASLAAASPLAEIAPGRAQIDANVTLGSSLKVERDGHTIDFDGDTRYRVGATVGISDGLGLDYTYASHEGDDNASVQSLQVNKVYQKNTFATLGGEENASGRGGGGNLVYQFIPYLYGFGGYVRNRAHHRGYTDNTNGFQVGATGRLPLGKTTPWAKFGIGNTITQYEVGVGYAITDNWEANVSYNDSKYKDFSGDTDVKTHGVNVGVSYKF